MPTEKDEYRELIEAEIEEKFNDFKSSFIARIRKPAIGVIVAIAALVALAGVYVYIDAASKIYKSQADLAKAQRDFYATIRESEKEVFELKNEMLEKFNDWAGDAEEKMLLTQEKINKIVEYEEEFRKILERHREAFLRGPHSELMEPEEMPDFLFEEEDGLKILPEEETPKEDTLSPPPPAQKSYKINPNILQQQRTQD